VSTPLGQAVPSDITTSNSRRSKFSKTNGIRKVKSLGNLEKTPVGEMILCEFIISDIFAGL